MFGFLVNILPMPRKLRLEYPGAIYHVMSRGDRREAIFLDDVDRQDFLKTLAEACVKAEFQIHAYCLMGNHFHLVVPAHRPRWLRVDRLLGEHGLQADTAEARQELERRIEVSRAAEDDGAQWAPLRRGWCLGSEEFKRQALARMEGQLGEYHPGDLRREAGEAKAERIIAEELHGLGWTEADLEKRHKSEPGKLALAARLRRETTLPLKWITARLRMGTWKSANARLRTWKQTQERKEDAH